MTARFAVVLFSLGFTLWCQEARMTGVVTDASGAVVADASITVTQVQRNLSFRAATDAEGRYVLPRLPI